MSGALHPNSPKKGATVLNSMPLLGGEFSFPTAIIPVIVPSGGRQYKQLGQLLSILVHLHLSERRAQS